MERRSKSSNHPTAVHMWTEEQLLQFAKALVKHPFALKPNTGELSRNQYQLRRRAVYEEICRDLPKPQVSGPVFWRQVQLFKEWYQHQLRELGAGCEMSAWLRAAEPAMRAAGGAAAGAGAGAAAERLLAALVERAHAARSVAPERVCAPPAPPPAPAAPARRLRTAWRRACRLVSLKLEAVLAAGDAESAADGVRLAAWEWRLAEAQAAWGRAPALRERHLLQAGPLRALLDLFHAVQRRGLEAPRAGARWAAAARARRLRGRRGGPVLLQRRWHALKAAARRRVLAAAALRPAPLRAFWLAPLLAAVVRRYPHVVTSRLPSWEELVTSGEVWIPTPAESEELWKDLTSEEIDSICKDYPEPEEEDDDLILLEPEIETIDLEEPPAEPELEQEHQLRAGGGGAGQVKVECELLEIVEEPLRLPGAGGGGPLAKRAKLEDEGDEADGVGGDGDEPAIDPKLIMTPVVLLRRIDDGALPAPPAPPAPPASASDGDDEHRDRSYEEDGREGRPSGTQKRVRLPNIEQVRRSQRSMLTAQVAPRTERKGAPGDGCLTVEKLDATLKKLFESGARRVRRCCGARRELLAAQARARLAARAGRPPPAPARSHGCAPGRCACCCRRLAAPRPLERPRRRLARALRRALDARPPHDSPDDESSSDSDSDSDSSTEEDVPPEADTFSDDTDDDRAPRRAVLEKGERRSGRSSTTKRPADDDETPRSDPLQEWIRQKNLTSRFFDLNLKKAAPRKCRPEPTIPRVPVPRVPLAPPVPSDPATSTPHIRLSPAPAALPVGPPGTVAVPAVFHVLPPDAAPRPLDPSSFIRVVPHPPPPVAVVDLCDSDEEPPPPAPAPAPRPGFPPGLLRRLARNRVTVRASSAPRQSMNSAQPAATAPGSPPDPVRPSAAPTVLTSLLPDGNNDGVKLIEYRTPTGGRTVVLRKTDKPGRGGAGAGGGGGGATIEVVYRLSALVISVEKWLEEDPSRSLYCLDSSAPFFLARTRAGPALAVTAAELAMARRSYWTAGRAPLAARRVPAAAARLRPPARLQYVLRSADELRGLSRRGLPFRVVELSTGRARLARLASPAPAPAPAPAGSVLRLRLSDPAAESGESGAESEIEIPEPPRAREKPEASAVGAASDGSPADSGGGRLSDSD